MNVSVMTVSSSKYEYRVRSNQIKHLSSKFEPEDLAGFEPTIFW